VSVIDLFRLDGRVAVVTGASSGLGVGFAQGFAEAGADVVVAARRAEHLRRTAALVTALGRQAVAVPTDVTDPDACAALVDTAMSRLGRIDVLVNNAGVATAIPASREEPDDFRSVIDVNLQGAYFMAQAVARVMRPGSSIINISSIVARISAGVPQAAYAASKAGLIGLTRDLAQQWTGRKGIRVNAVLPGLFPSEIWESHRPGYREGLLARTPAGRVGEMPELAATVIFLAGDGAGFISGASIVVDGGYTIG
jgi:NAD(P)-dependent dehydrogenase (short-subunit alcohol dehydrogenase family)